MVHFAEEYDGRPIRKVEASNDKIKTTIHSNSSFNLSLSSLRAGFISVFLPNGIFPISFIFSFVGYPNSVSEDYLTYQVWDTLQALASSLTGALATEAVLRGAGVGDQVDTAEIGRSWHS